MTIHAADVRKGMVLVDHHGQFCRIERVDRFRQRVIKIYTRRKDGSGWWNCMAEWSPDQFDARQFIRSKKVL